MFKKTSFFFFLVIFLFLVTKNVFANSETQPLFLGMGDSIGEGVQSADASQWTQPFSYLNLLAWRMGVAFPLPLIKTGPFGFVNDTTFRLRLEPEVEGLNLAVSGANLDSILRDRANAIDISQIDSEIDLVLFPRIGSQIEIAEKLQASFVACWIGNNDVLKAVTSFDNLDASQMTSVQDFFIDFTELVWRLKASGSKVVFGTIPDVSRVGFLLDREDLIRFLGADYGLREGDRTSIIAMLLIKSGLAEASIIDDPKFVLDASEIEAIRQRISIFNFIIKYLAMSNGMAVADIHALFEKLAINPPHFFGIPLTTRFLGGVFSLDGLHPSNIAHAILTNEFINAFNDHYQLNIMPIEQSVLEWFFFTDPFIDKDQDGRVTGRFGAGFLETILLLLDISGDSDDFIPNEVASAINRDTNENFIEQYRRLTSKDLRSATLSQRIEAFRGIFGLNKRHK